MPTLEIGQKTSDYPHGYGFCQCGCGKKTKRLYFGNYARYANVTHNPNPMYKIELRRYLPQISRKRKAASQAVSVGYPEPKPKGDPDLLSSAKIGDVVPGFEKGWGHCQCGCGGHTRIYKGRARRFIVGHSSKTAEFRLAQSLRAAEQAREADFSPYDRIGRSVRGTHFSPKLGRPVNFMSLYEKKAFEILDDMQNVLSYEEQPFSLSYFYDGNRFTYVPDILVCLVNGRKVLLEIKPESRLDSRRIQAKHGAAQAFCQDKGMLFLVVTETQLFKKEKIALSEPSAEG